MMLLAAFQTLLVERKVDFVHFQHFIGHVPSLVYIAKSLGVPTAITVHDYLSVCNEYQLISFKGGFCGAPDVSLAQCDLCLWKKHQILPGSQAARRDFWNGALAAADLLASAAATAAELRAMSTCGTVTTITVRAAGNTSKRTVCPTGVSRKT